MMDNDDQLYLVHIQECLERSVREPDRREKQTESITRRKSR